MNGPRRPPGAPDVDHPLLVAARYNDAEAEDHQIDEVCRKHGLDFEAVMYIAEQRAIRRVLAHTGRIGEVSATKSSPVRLSEGEKAMVEFLLPAYFDAIMIGWRAKELS